jgi:hypothetical protein
MIYLNDVTESIEKIKTHRNYTEKLVQQNLQDEKGLKVCSCLKHPKKLEQLSIQLGV